MFRYLRKHKSKKKFFKKYTFRKARRVSSLTILFKYVKKLNRKNDYPVNVKNDIFKKKAVIFFQQKKHTFLNLKYKKKNAFLLRFLKLNRTKNIFLLKKKLKLFRKIFFMFYALKNKKNILQAIQFLKKIKQQKLTSYITTTKINLFFSYFEKLLTTVIFRFFLLKSTLIAKKIIHNNYVRVNYTFITKPNYVIKNEDYIFLNPKILYLFYNSSKIFFNPLILWQYTYFFVVAFHLLIGSYYRNIVFFFLLFHMK